MASVPGHAALPTLGKHKMRKGCLYVHKRVDIDVGVLRALVKGSVVEVKRRYDQE